MRASVLRQWRDRSFPSHGSDVDDVTRFNESIDQSLAKAVNSYSKRVDQSRDLFLAILSHDLRNPLNSIAMSAMLLPHLIPPTSDVIEVVSQISTNADVMARMISDLLDYTRTRLGAGMPVSPTIFNLSDLCQELYSEFVTAHPDRQIRLKSAGDVRGKWDSDRLRQAISNLLGNAIQHSPAEALVELRLSSNATDAIVTAVGCSDSLSGVHGSVSTACLIVVPAEVWLIRKVLQHSSERIFLALGLDAWPCFEVFCE